MSTVVVALPVYSDDGAVVDTTTAILDDDQASDVVAQAVQLIYDFRRKERDHARIDEGLIMELEEALQSYSLIEDGDYAPVG
jgi:hypothetical protein